MTFEEAVELLGGPLDPTDEEAKNGWTTESLSCYHAEREIAKADLILNPKPVRATRTMNALRWHGLRRR